MKKILLILLLSFFYSVTAEAKHIAGGEMSYEYLGPGSGTNLRYRVTLKLYRDCFTQDGAPLDDVAAISIFRTATSSMVETRRKELDRVDILQLSNPGPCIDNPPPVCYEVGVYIFDIELPPIPGGYDISYQRCCRIENITNVSNSGSTGATYTAHIPGSDVQLNAARNSSPKFNTKDTVVICEDNPFFL